MNRHKLYRPLLERTLENYQVQHLARRYDFGKESLIAHLLVKEINSQVERAEEAIGIKRVKPFELYLKKGHSDAALPLFLPSYLEPILNGGDFNQSRALVIKECWERYRRSFPEKRKEGLLKLIDPWQKVPKKGPSIYVEQLTDKNSSYDPKDSTKWAGFINEIKPVPPTERLHMPDVSAPQKLLQKFTQFAVTEAGIGPLIARQLVEDVITLRNICCPRTGELKSGEMPLLVTHVSARLSEDYATCFRQLAPVIITVLNREEQTSMPETVPEYIELFKKRLLRVCFEAYRQNGLLTLMELQWIFQISTARISELLRSLQLEYNLVAPTPGTILDAGKSMTHKKVIVGLHLEGHTVKDIARITHHSPRAVDNYIGTYEAVLILYLFGMPPPLMARVLNRSIALIREHIELADKVFEDHLAIKKYLKTQGVKI